MYGRGVVVVVVVVIVVVRCLMAYEYHIILVSHHDHECRSCECAVVRRFDLPGT